MADLRLVANAMFMNRSEWVKIPESEKEMCFFIFNRYFSKKYPEKSQLLNNKNINKSLGMDLWFNYMSSKPYPKWFWSKDDQKKKEDTLPKTDRTLLMLRLKISQFDLDYLLCNFPDFIEEELKYLKKLEKL